MIFNGIPGPKVFGQRAQWNSGIVFPLLATAVLTLKKCRSGILGGVHGLGTLPTLPPPLKAHNPGVRLSKG